MVAWFLNESPVVNLKFEVCSFSHLETVHSFRLRRSRQFPANMTKIFAFTRESPYTNNNGDSQDRRIILACNHLWQIGELPKIDNRIPRFDGLGESRGRVLSCSTTHELFNAVMRVEKAECVFVIITSLLRIGKEYGKIMMFYAVLMKCHPKVKLIVIDEWALDLPSSAMALSTYHASLRSLEAEVSHRNPGATMPVSDEHRDLKEEVAAQALILKRQWINAKCLPEEIRATLHDNNITRNEVFIDSLINGVLGAIRYGNSIEEIVRDFRNTLWPQSFSGARQVAYYIRTSPNTSSNRSITIDGIAVDQMSMCDSYYHNSPDYNPTTQVVTFQDMHKMRRTFNPGLKCLLTRVLDGRVGAVYMKNTNRLSSKISVFASVLEICRQCGTSVHFAEMIGVDIYAAVMRDTQRLAMLEQYRTAYHQAINDRKRKLNARDLEIRERLLEIKTHVLGSPFLLDDTWSEWTTTQGITEEDDE
jgi:hypothetical protein